MEASGGGTVSIQQFPVGGLSLVETFPSTPSLDTLLPNPALIDGDLLASAGIDIGFGPSLAGDQNLRDLGVLFANATTEVNALRLWVDRQLPPAVAAAYAFTAWRSDDNLTWTQVPITGPVAFGAFENRFEIPIPRTQARYLKVVTRPLSTSVTVDPQYAAVLVTELQAFLVVPASEAPREQPAVGGHLQRATRGLLLWQDWNLAYTFAFRTSHQNSFALQEWSVLNSLGAGRHRRARGERERPARAAPTRPSRTVPHEAVNRWSAQVGYDPFPTLGGSLTYSGQYGQLYVGDGRHQRRHADRPRRPVAGGEPRRPRAATPGRGTSSGARSRARTARVGVTLTPLQVLAFNGTWGVSSALALTPAGLVQTQRTTSLQGSVSFTPVRALYFTAGVLRSSGLGPGAARRSSTSAPASPPSPGASSSSASATTRTSTRSRAVRNRVFGPSLRWNIRTGHLPRRRLHLERLHPARAPHPVAQRSSPTSSSACT